MSLTLYYHPLSSYCHKVLIALYERGLEFERRIIDLGDAADRAELAAIWPFTRFPVLRDRARGRDLAESTIIVEYLDRIGSASALMPAHPEAALEARFWDRICDTCLEGPLQQIVLDRLRGAGADTSAARATLRTAYDVLERQLASRQWLAGAAFTLADCAAAPALFYTSTLEPFAGHQRELQRYFEQLIERPSIRRVIGEAAPSFRHYPFQEAIPARFRSVPG